jgi:DHA2 family multidrug resistance protein
MQTNFPYTAMLSGLAMMPGGIAMLIMMPIVGRFAGYAQPKYMIATGFIIIAAAMWYSTTLVPDASFTYFAFLRVLQTIGMPFMFIPINMVAYTGLPPQKTAQGSALINVARNLGGSVSVALANTELVQRSQFHQARLVDNLPQSSPTFQSAMHNLTQYFTQFGSPVGAQGRALGYIGHLISDQAALLGYIDIFYSWAIFAAVLVPIVLLLIRRIGPVSGEAAAGH